MRMDCTISGGIFQARPRRRLQASSPERRRERPPRSTLLPAATVRRDSRPRHRRSTASLSNRPVPCRAGSAPQQIGADRPICEGAHQDGVAGRCYVRQVEPERVLPIEERTQVETVGDAVSQGLVVHQPRVPRGDELRGGVVSHSEGTAANCGTVASPPWSTSTCRPFSRDSSQVWWNTRPPGST